MADKNGGTSPWVYIGCGCGALLLGALAVTGACGLFAFKTIKNIESQANDPAARHAAALDTLGADELPEGYVATTTFSVPFGMVRFVVLENEEEGAGFVYVDTAERWENLQDYVDGRRDPSRLARDLGADVDRSEPIGSGAVALPGGELFHWTYPGPVSFDQFRSHGPTWRVDKSVDHALIGDDDGTFTLMALRCEDNPRQRIGLWTRPAGAEAQSDAGVEGFVAGFRVCAPGDSGD